MRSTTMTQPVPGTSTLAALADAVRAGGVVVLSGAGLSTESGIPDYRGPAGVRRNHRPMTYQEFVGSPQARRRYWARSYLGWRLIDTAAPNAGHRAVATLQWAGLVTGIITQNVDGLHQAAGAHDVLELHGSLAMVRCLTCGRHTSRAGLDRRMLAANPGFADRTTVAEVHPDGDVPLADADVAGFVVPDCDHCGGVLKPDVVYFGESVPRPRVDHSYTLVDDATLLLVLGSSLAVMSGYRFVLRAAEHATPIAIINSGETRGDAKATYRLDAPLGATLTDLAHRVERS